LGFLTIIENPEHGLFGGYLILNRAGRPLEFHCTAPVKPNRAQQILYGPTLEPFLFGEQIGQSLLDKARSEPVVVCTDREPALAVREFTKVPVALVLPPEEPGAETTPGHDASANETPADDAPAGDALASNSPAAAPPTGGKVYRCDPAHGYGRCGPAFRIGPNRLAVSLLAADDRQAIAERLATLGDRFDLAEPFQRIREAIEEARRGGQ
jgi:hypothetical protein